MDDSVVALLTGLAGALIGAGAVLGSQWLAIAREREKEATDLLQSRCTAVCDAFDALEDALLSTQPTRINIRTMPELSAVTRALAALDPNAAATKYLYQMRSLLVHAHALPSNAPQVGAILLGAVDSGRSVVMAEIRNEDPVFDEAFVGIAEMVDGHGHTLGSRAALEPWETARAAGAGNARARWLVAADAGSRHVRCEIRGRPVCTRASRSRTTTCGRGPVPAVTQKRPCDDCC